MKALVAGAEGQLGQALVARLGAQVVWAGGRGSLDITDAAAVERLVAATRPDVVFNAAAYNKVDGAEGDPAGALAVNATGPRHLARAAAAVGALMVHVSTDYVFAGDAGRAYTEADCPRPQSVYGTSKLAGELLVQGARGQHLVVRTSGVFAAGASKAKGGSFVERILQRARAGEPLRVVDDQVLSPTYAPDLALGLVQLVEAGARGLVHLTNSGECSWHAFASAALREAGIEREVERIRTPDLDLPAARPAYSVLANERVRALGLPLLRDWREALREFLK